MELQHLLQKFISQARDSDQITVYNSARLRHELANFLQHQLDQESYGVQVCREVEAVVLGGNTGYFSEAVIDVYIFQKTGGGQHAVQVFVSNIQNKNSSVEEVKHQLMFLETLKQHNFTQTYFLLAQKAPLDESGLKIIFDNKVDWQELQPVSQDTNGPWRCAVLPV